MENHRFTYDSHIFTWEKMAAMLHDQRGTPQKMVSWIFLPSNMANMGFDRSPHVILVVKLGPAPCPVLVLPLGIGLLLVGTLLFGDALPAVQEEFPQWWEKVTQFLGAPII